MITISSLAATYSSAVTYNAATGTTSTTDASASNTTASTTANPSGQLSAAVAAKVTQALAPATAGIKQLNTSLTQGQTKLSALGQVQSAIADFQTLAKTLGSSSTTATSADVTKNVKSFVTAYNALNTKLASLQSGDLKTDPGLAQVSAQMTQTLRDAGGTSSTGALSKAGISLSGGQLTIDSTKLTAALSANPSAVAGLLSGNGNGVADRLSSKLGALTSTGGAIGRETSAATRDISATETKRATLTKTLTAQATALAALYTQQEQAGASGGATSLFDMMG
ncbi:flagellar filament capping protein FliD [Massilia sp. S19_KUP03_FR1]|uniref:flagellar filament capping protein FliD n=1 Tax=Massilia sp. S19_KUP03_FR1 TaxID=3025503 RepID=UPI002FCD7E3B